MTAPRIPVTGGAVVDREAAISDYVAAYEAANGKPITQNYLPLTYERGWVLFRDLEAPHRIVARHRRGELWRMARRLREAAGIPVREIGP